MFEIISFFDPPIKLPIRDRRWSLMPVIICDIHISVCIQKLLDSAVIAVEVICEVPDLMLCVQLLVSYEFNVVGECAVPNQAISHLQIVIEALPDNSDELIKRAKDFTLKSKNSCVIFQS